MDKRVVVALITLPLPNMSGVLRVWIIVRSSKISVTSAIEFPTSEIVAVDAFIQEPISISPEIVTMKQTTEVASLTSRAHGAILVWSKMLPNLVE